MSYNFVDVEPNSKEHFDFKKGKIGASYAPIILGQSPFQTKLQLWEEIVFEKPKETTHQMQRGIDLEPIARDWFNKQMGVSFSPVCIQSKDYSWLIASLDGFYDDQIVEIKCPGKEAHLEAIQGRIPEYYYAQLQHQMMVADVKQMFYVSFDGTDGVILTLDRDDKFCKTLLKEEQEFYYSILEFRPPKETDEDWIAVVDQNLIDKSNLLEAKKNMIKSLQVETDQLQDEITQNLSHPRSKVGKLRFQKIVKKGAIDYAKIPVLKDLDLEQYRKPSCSFWKIFL